MQTGIDEIKSYLQQIIAEVKKRSA